MTNDKDVPIKTSKYFCKENIKLVKNREQINKNIIKMNLLLLMLEVEIDLKEK